MTAITETAQGRHSLIFDTPQGRFLFLTHASRLYEVGEWPGNEIKQYVVGELPESDLLEVLGLSESDMRFPQTILETPLRALSLNVAQSCNLACRYCYADEGKFGGRARMMDRSTAERAVNMLISGTEKGERLLVGFMGGEPMLNRKLVRHITDYALARAGVQGVDLRFSITTNATLLIDDDVAMFRDNPYAVQISIDGGKAVNDASRPMHNGRGSFALVEQAIERFERLGRPRSLSGRATVLPGTRDLAERLDALIDLGFDDVGFAPVLSSPNPQFEFSVDELHVFTQQMIECGTKALAQLLEGKEYPFSNFHTALREIHLGSHRPRSCGAGESYMSVDSDGGLFACHRLVGDESFRMGDLDNGVDHRLRRNHISTSHVDLQEPCRDCWARYLCGGGCHHEVSKRGRVACDFIRDWLTFCLGAYLQVQDERPDYFGSRGHN